MKKNKQMLTEALARYKGMLNNPNYAFMHEQAREHIAEIEKELEEIEDVD